MSEIAKFEPHQPAPEASAPITPMQMLQIAVEQNADLDKLTKLMDLNERWEANEARKAFVAAKAAFKSEAPTIGKNKHVGFDAKNGGARTDYHHATLDNVADALAPTLSKHGFSYSWDTDQLDGGLIRVTCVLTHMLGHSEQVSLQAGPDQSGNKNNIQAVGSTVTYLQRYTLLAVTGTATGDQDTDGHIDHEPITAEQKGELVALIKKSETDTVRFLRYLNVETLDKLPAAEFPKAKSALESKLTQSKGGKK